jgi:predicted dehydrogenase
MNKVRWGVLSTALIGVAKVIPAMQRGQYCEVTGLASRDLAKAQEAAARLGIPRCYGSYEDLLADPDIDAVYNPLPNHLHVPWSLKALAAGKHVLCEKPIGLSSAEGQQLVDAARANPRLKVMEAFMYRHHPQWQKARQLVNEGAIGHVRTIQTFFSYYLDDPANIRNMPDIGGGGLWDIGCYAISAPRFIFGREPVRVCGIVEFDPRFGTDRLASALLDFGANVEGIAGTATFTVSTQLAPYQRVHIVGTAGRIEIEIPFNAPPDRPCRIWLQREGGFVAGAGIEEILLPTADQYTVQGDLFARAILEDTEVPTPIEDAVANMKVIERVFASDKSGGWA